MFYRGFFWEIPSSLIRINIGREIAYFSRGAFTFSNENKKVKIGTEKFF